MAQLVARTAGGREAAGSSPVTPTSNYYPRRGMGTILKIIIIGGLAWGYFACVQGLSNKALAELNDIKQIYNVDSIEARLTDSN